MPCGTLSIFFLRCYKQKITGSAADAKPVIKMGLLWRGRMTVYHGFPEKSREDKYKYTSPIYTDMYLKMIKGD